MTAPVGYEEIKDTFGDIEDYLLFDGSISSGWEMDILTLIDLPFPMFFLGDKMITHMRCHNLLKDNFISVFEEITMANLVEKCKDFGGCYNFRFMRRAHKFSTHSWGIAIDLNPETNQMGTEGDMDEGIIEIFKKHGFTWGGEFKTPDPMHFQYCEGY